MPPTPSAQYSLTLRIEIDHRPGMLGKVASAIGDAGGTIGAVDLVEVEGEHTIRDILGATDSPFLMHLGDKIERHNKSPVKTRDDLSMAYSPGVARVCNAIHDDPEKVYNLTIKQHTVAVVADGSAVLGLGDIGPEAALPVMEGKCLIFKSFAGVDAFPIALATKDVDEIVRTVKAISPIFGGVNLGE